MHSRSLPLLCAFIVALFVLFSAVADIQADGHRRGKHRGDAPPCAQNPAYILACGSCHMPYSPMLLPAASWEKLVPASGEHFGQHLDLKNDELTNIRNFLRTNAADNCGRRLGNKIVASLNAGEIPERLEDVPYLRRKHRKIDPEVFKRPAVGGFANCVACHSGAPRCNFDDDYVRIPQ